MSESSAAAPCSVHGLTAARALVDSGTYGEREDERPRCRDPAWMTPRCGRHESGSRRRLGRGDLGIVIEDLMLESLQSLARLEAELLSERTATLLVGAQRFGLSSRPVEREHELSAQPLSKRLLGDELLELDDELVVAPEREIGFDPLFQRCEPKLVETGDLGLREVRVPELDEGRPTPERKRIAEQVGRRRGFALRERSASFLEAHAKRGRVELVGLEVEPVPVSVGLEGAAGGAQRAS